MSRKTIAVVELSSFQLEDSPSFRPRAAVVLNVSPNHLDRHGSMKNYTQAKEKIFANQQSDDFLILNFDDARVRAMSKKAKSRVIFFSKDQAKADVHVSGGAVVVLPELSKKPMRIPVEGFGLAGRHNLENILAAVAAASLFGVPAASMKKTLDAFKTLKHRIEPLGLVKGVSFVNDSKSTTVASTRAALEAMDRPVVLIAGGRDKGSSFEEIEALVAKKARWGVLYGEAAPKILSAWKKFKRVKHQSNFSRAVRLAFDLSKPGDAILLSPMCTSFDQFGSYGERGEAFKMIFKNLKRDASWKP
jgi:UDP-N-acetylmuramoylalanine--D-glutamate ligase